MVRKPKFKLIAKGEDITEKLSKILLALVMKIKKKLKVMR